MIQNGKESDNWDRWLTHMESSCHAHAANSYPPLGMSEHPKKNLSGQRREQATNSCHSKMGHGFKPVTQ